MINKENRMITLRHSPQLALIKTAINEDGTEITVQAEGMNPLTLKPKKEVDTTDEIVPLVCVLDSCS